MNNYNTKNRAFTLVELLVVIVIISILASMSMYALSGTVNAAKESKTRGTISKLNAAIMEIYEGYQDKFDNIASMANNSALPAKELEQAKVKLHLIHDLMRMEMPDKIDEVLFEDVSVDCQPSDYTYTYNGKKYNYKLKDIPAVKKFYENSINSAGTPDPEDSGYDPGIASAELLYLIIANLNPEALENFHGSEINDTNGNNLMEFLDAWGNPIRFIRFAPDFPYSEIQPKREDDKTNYQDPFNPEYIQDTTGEIPDPDPSTWLLFPLIYSCGADGADGISHNGYTITGDQSIAPFAPSNEKGKVIDAGGYDNIHNHRGSNSF